jgi:hypothetical protein
MKRKTLPDRNGKATKPRLPANAGGDFNARDIIAWPFLPYALLAVITIASFLLKMYFLLQVPHILGMDSGYYVWHVADTANGQLYLSEPPLVFLFAAAIAKILGDAILGVKLTIAIFSAAMAIPAYFIVKEISKKDSLALSAAFLASFSASNWWIADGHVKNIAGLFFGLFAVLFFIRSLASFERRNILLLAASFLLMLASHFSSAAYITAVLFSASLAIAAYSLIRKKTDEPAFRASALFFALSIASALAIIAIRPGLLTGSSIGSIGLQEGGLLSPPPDEPGADAPPLINFNAFGNYFPFSLLAFAALYIFRKKKDMNMLILFSIWLFASVMLTQRQFVETSWIKRFEMMGFLPFAILIPLGAAHFENKLVVYALLAIACAFSAYGLFEGNAHWISAPVSNDEYLQLVAMHAERPDMTVYATDMPVRYWLHAIGFRVIDPPETGEQVIQPGTDGTMRWNATNQYLVGRYIIYEPVFEPGQDRPLPAK